MGTTSFAHSSGPPRIGTGDNRFGPNLRDFSDPEPSPNKKVRGLEKRVRGAGDRLQQKLKARETFGAAFLKDSLARGRQFESSAEELRAKQLAQIDSIGGRQNALATGAGSAVQQQFSAPQGGGARGFSRALDQSLRRGKARQGIINRGDNAIRNQRLKDRLQATRASVVRRGQLQQTSADAARLEAGIDITQTNANVGVNQAMIGAGGAILGGIASGISGRSGGNQGFGFDQSTIAAGTGAADFQIGQGFGDFDINNVGGGSTMYA